MNLTYREILLMRLEAKWQFRRLQLLRGMFHLKADKTSEAWEKTLKDLAERKSNPDNVIRRLADNWMKRATSAQALIQFIRENFEADTAEGPTRHRLQDLSEGHPFGAIISETERMTIYRWVNEPLKESSSLENLADRNPDDLTPIQKVYQRKEWSRLEDRRQLEAGEITAEELNRQNCIIPWQLTVDPKWKQTALESVIKQMAKSQSRSYPRSLMFETPPIPESW